MTSSIGEGLRRIVLDLGLFSEVYLHQAPQTAVPPYLTYNDNLSTAPELKGDGRTTMWVRQMEMNLWQTLAQEDPAVLRSLRKALDGATIVLDTGRVLKLEVRSVDNIPEPISDQILHHSITVECKHDAEAV